MIRRFLVGATLFTLAACTSTPEPAPPPGQKIPKSPATDRDPRPSPEVTLPIALDINDIKARFAPKNIDINAQNLNYKFSYASVTKADGIKFDASGKATLVFPGLPSGVKSNLSLEIFEGTTLRLRGEIKDLTLTGSSVKLPLQLQTVDGADLTILVSIEGISAGGGLPPVASPSPSTSSGPDVTPSVSPSPQTTPIAPPTTTPSVPVTPDVGAFNREIKALFEKRCSECHHTGGVPPDLTVLPTATIIDQALANMQAGKMPKAPRDKMTTVEIQKIKAWRDAGMNP